MQMTKLSSEGAGCNASVEKESMWSPTVRWHTITLQRRGQERRGEERRDERKDREVRRLEKGRWEEWGGEESQHLETVRHHRTRMVNLFSCRRGKGREICFLSSSILSVFVQTSCISSTSCVLPALTDGCFSLICTLLWPTLPHTPPPPRHWVKLWGKMPTWGVDYSAYCFKQPKLFGHTEKLLAVCRTQWCIINRPFPNVLMKNNDLDIMHLNAGAECE